jgi:hypothetical protein
MKANVGADYSFQCRTLVALVSGLFGCILVEVALNRVGASFKAQVCAALPALYIAFISIRHLRIYQPKFLHEDIRPEPRSANIFDFEKTGGALLLLLLGVALGLLVLAGSAVIISLVAFSLFLRWPRKPLQARSFGAGSAIMLFGASASFMLGQREVDLLFLPIASLMLTMCATLILLWNVFGLRRSS